MLDNKVGGDGLLPKVLYLSITLVYPKKVRWPATLVTSGKAKEEKFSRRTENFSVPLIIPIAPSDPF